MKVMCIMNQNILNVKSGGGQCAKRNYDSIKQSLSDSDMLYTCIVSPEFENINERGSELYIPGLIGNIQSAIAALQGCKCCKKKYEKIIWKFIDRVEPDVIYLDTSKLGKMSKIMKKKYRCKVICFFHNVESDYSLNFVKNRGKQYLLSYWASLKNERIVVKYADKLISLTKKDSDRIQNLYGRQTDIIIPISFEDKYIPENKNIDKRKGLLFVGSLFSPNFDGIKWFVREVMIKLPEQTLTIVGKGFEKKREILERENVKVVGTVDDLEEYYYTYPVMIMPIQYGAGMKVKTAEAMMYGKIIIATDEALEGYEINNIEGVYRCNTADEFIKSIRYVMQEKTDYENNVIRTIFMKHYEFKATRKQFEQVIKG